MTSQHDVDVAIIGGGPVGLAAALGLEAAGLSVAVLERAPEAAWEEPAFDGREIALTYHARDMLTRLGAWQHIPQAAISPLNVARVETGRQNLPLIFDAPSTASRTGTGESGAAHEPLGWLISNNLIRRALYAEVAARPAITRMAGVTVEMTRRDNDGAVTHFRGLSAGTVRSRVVIGADGRFSPTRRRAGIGAAIHDFQRVMMVCRMAHDEPHHHIALQWFDEGQTIALLPVNGGASSLVLTLPGEEIQHLLHADQDAFNAEICERVGRRLGAMRLISTRHTYPLKAVYAHRFTDHRLALIGDAAVGMHPITAHGFNLGLRGAETLTTEMARAADKGTDIGAASVLRRYDHQHRAVTLPMFAATNGIASLYTRDSAPFRALRGLGLRVANALPPFKTAVTSMLMDRGASASP